MIPALLDSAQALFPAAGPKLLKHLELRAVCRVPAVQQQAASGPARAAQKLACL
jgi:hypothetical protein